MTLSLMGILRLAVSAVMTAIGVNAAADNRRLADRVGTRVRFLSNRYDTRGALPVFSRDRSPRRPDSAPDRVSRETGRSRHRIDANIATREGISGTILLASRHTREITDGKRPGVRPLRKDDGFRELYGPFARMVETPKGREKKRR
jgi:hypothetical protein